MVFELMLLTCVTYTSLDESFTRNCTWMNGPLYRTEELCRAAGAPQIGKPWYGFIVEDRKIERFRCFGHMVWDTVE